MLALIAIALLNAVPPDQIVLGWEVYGDDSSCSADKTYDDDTTLSFSLDNTLDSSSITLWNNRWQSIEKDHAYVITVRFDSDEPLSFEASGMKTDSAGGIFIDSGGVQTMARAMAAKTVTFRNGAQIIGKYDLSGSRAAMLAIARCNGKAANKRVDDPFAG